jgi:hypothetical protein
MGKQDRRFFDVAMVALFAGYLIAVGVLALVKTTTSLVARVSWIEVFGGPAITFISGFLLFVGAISLERLVRGRKR